MIYIKASNKYNTTYRQYKDVSELINFIKEDLCCPNFEGKTVNDCLRFLNIFKIQQVEEITAQEFENISKEIPMENNWLKILRAKNGLTQKELAEETGLTISTIQNIEQNKRKGSKETLKVLNDYFNNNK